MVHRGTADNPTEQRTSQGAYAPSPTVTRARTSSGASGWNSASSFATTIRWPAPAPGRGASVLAASPAAPPDRRCLPPHSPSASRTTEGGSRAGLVRGKARASRGRPRRLPTFFGVLSMTQPATISADYTLRPARSPRCSPSWSRPASPASSVMAIAAQWRVGVLRPGGPNVRGRSNLSQSHWRRVGTLSGNGLPTGRIERSTVSILKSASSPPIWQYGSHWHKRRRGARWV